MKQQQELLMCENLPASCLILVLYITCTTALADPLLLMHDHVVFSVPTINMARQYSVDHYFGSTTVPQVIAHIIPST